jgi:ELWxxDGT repeat protein
VVIPLRKAASLAVVLLSLPLLAQTPYLVKDINTTFAVFQKSSSPTGFVSYNGRVFFATSTDDAGTELWSTDGTATGTLRVAVIASRPLTPPPGGFIVLNGKLFFTARDADHGNEMWVTDGTPGGTRVFMDINPGPGSSQPAPKVILKNQMLFGADDGTNGRELWITDGTVAGTKLLKDITPGSRSSSPSSLTVFGDAVYFFAETGLWKTDGTDSGTMQVAPVSGRNLTVAGSHLFFGRFTFAAGWEPWVSDGTEAGTHMIADIWPGADGSLSQFNVGDFIAFGSKVIFLANNGVNGREMWITDGTPAGTGMVHDFVPGPAGAWNEAAGANLTAFASRVYFSWRDDDHGEEVWVTDGTDAGTSRFADLTPGPASSNPFSFVVSGSKLFFGGSGGGNPFSNPFWVTDGTVDGTHLLKASDGSGFGYNGDAWPIGGKLYFAGSTALMGAEPWVTDGTDAGTRMIANIAPDLAPSSFPSTLTAAGDLLFFYAKEGLPWPNGANSSLWRSDGTEAGTFRVREGGQNPQPLQAVGPYVFFEDAINGQTALMMSDGTVAGTRPADDFVRRFGPSRLGTFFPFRDTLYATVFDLGIHDSSLWKTTTAINAPAEQLGAKNPFGMIESSGRQVFFAEGPKGLGTYSLWTTDGTRAGTHAIMPDLGDTVGQQSNVVSAEGTLFFVRQLPGEGGTLWKSDGTFEGTTVVKAIPAGPSGLNIKAAGRRVFFVAGDALWTSDGSAAGTIELAKVTFDPSSVPDDLRVAGSRIVFTPKDPATINRLWSSDGTVAGTRALQSTGPVAQLTSIDGLVYFAGSDDLHGTEVWATDGTAEGTKLIADVNPGPNGSDPSNFTKVGNLLYFSAFTDGFGYELWALPLTESTLSIGDVRIAEGDSGTSTARFAVALTPAAQQPVTVNYASSDGTAKAGEDYDAVSGTLSFAPGETVKTIDVRVRGDLAAENNETLYVALSGAVGARIVSSEGVGIIEDDDGAADLRIAPAFTLSGAQLLDSVNVSNAGPRAATDISVRFTSVPAFGSRCSVCLIPQIAAGGSASAGSDSSALSFQAFLSATATSRQRDPQTSNNSTTWTVNANRTMAMDAAYLTTGSTATVTAVTETVSPSVALSDASVVSVSNVSRTGSLATFTVKGLKPGSSSVSLDRSSFSLLVTVVNPGTTPVWPGALKVGVNLTATTFERPVTLTVEPAATAPISGVTATGTITLTAGGNEVTRRTISGPGAIPLTLYLPSLGSVPWQIAYSGDANFQQQILSGSVVVSRGKPTLTADLRPVVGSTGTYILTIRATGSPVAAPGGTIIVSNGAAELARLTLAPAGEASAAQTTLRNLPASPTLTLNYQGDAFYDPGSQQVRSVDSRRRAVHH